MLKHIWIIFKRDLKVNLRDFLSLYIMLAPILLAIGINAFTPGINDTTVNVAFIKGENTEQVEYFKQFAKVEELKDLKEIKDRVSKRDNIVAILKEDDSYYIMAQGNEPEMVSEYARVLNALYISGAKIEDTNAELIDFQKTVPPLKKVWANAAIMMTSVLGGMLIALNIIEEKTNNTVSAINVTPVSRKTFILGKSMIGLIVPVFGTICIVLITGFRDINIIQIASVTFAASLISLLVGFIEGINNDDIMTAAGSIKLLFLPMGAAMAAIELLGDKWQKFFYWIPFYWAYKGNDAVLSKVATWREISIYIGIILFMCGLIYILLAPRIRKGLE